LEGEIECGLEQLSRANQLLAECQVTYKRTNQTKPKKSTKTMKSSVAHSDSDSSSMDYTKPLMGSKK